MIREISVYIARKLKYILLVGIVFLLLSVIDMPLMYYTFLRIVVFSVACLALYVEYAERRRFTLWYIPLLAVAVLFNPVVPIFLDDRGLWIPCDLVAAFIFAIKIFFIPKHKEEEGYL